MPPALQDWLPPDDLAYFLLDAVEQFDLTPFYAAYRADGVGQGYRIIGALIPCRTCSM
jgi:hypothetical protein